MRNLAFSLIELLIVIAVVAIIAAVAFPIYKSYSLKAKVSSLIPIAQEIQRKSVDFYMKYGYMPKASEIGYPTTALFNGQENIADSVALQMSPYLLPNTLSQMNGIVIFGSQYGMGSDLGSMVPDNATCNPVQEIVFTLDTDTVGQYSFIYTFGPELSSGAMVVGCELRPNDGPTLTCPGGSPMDLVSGSPTTQTGGAYLPSVRPVP